MLSHEDQSSGQLTDTACVVRLRRRLRTLFRDIVAPLGAEADDERDRSCGVPRRTDEAAGHKAASGYRVEGDFVAWTIDGRRQIVLAERARRGWLLAEVGVGGGGVYPEDDLAEEAGIALPFGALLIWDDNAERAVLARSLAGGASAADLQRALSSFRALAERLSGA